ncbi:alkyldihydroxyacetonephosphate synthase isoform X2 [Sitophilus oryzae]|uniref:Alkylglycerone-phosphate synthase n=1 Tax=Sitophilus oryzae TaxID=7048 RepID=A0A6J2Y8F8_SITOR|nr:alkyldihydroxyacetonephosphate synthase isoform X2 [Sitophilus oryzae]
MGVKKVTSVDVESTIPKIRQDLLKWNGWGYKDSQFVIRDGVAYFTGQRYSIGNLTLPHLAPWVISVLNIDLNKYNVFNDPPKESDYPPPKLTKEIYEKLEKLNIPHSIKVIDRVVRAHGHTLKDIFILKYGRFDRVPDLVLWPKGHDDVVKIVKLADENDMVIIPFGGGTAVSGAVECPTGEDRPIISLDTTQMNRILWLDEKNLVACCESGIIGQDLERELNKLGFTCGHEPDSYEFSSLGGWVATRASGMKKNTYGNIEDLLVHVKMVTPKGLLQKNCQVPRLSCGPDFNHVIMGSEGSLGVITEVVIKIRPVPKIRRYGSIIFYDFEDGVNCMREVARQRCQPASIRLMDNDQFKFGLIVKPQSTFMESVVDGLKKVYVTKIKKFDPDRMCVMTLLFEGDENEVKVSEKRIYDIAATFRGVPAGETNGERGYMLTFLIAYIRDLALQFNIVAESFETSCPWDRAITLVKNVKQVIANECRNKGITHFIINSRVTQTYDAGCVIYFYLGFNYTNLPDPVGLFHHLEDSARDEIINCGGSISHHHGVGKLRKRWYKNTVSQVGVDLFLAIKNEVDPKNTFATNNLVSRVTKSKL